MKKLMFICFLLVATLLLGSNTHAWSYDYYCSDGTFLYDMGGGDYYDSNGYWYYRM